MLSIILPIKSPPMQVEIPQSEGTPLHFACMGIHHIRSYRNREELSGEDVFAKNTYTNTSIIVGRMTADARFGRKYQAVFLAGFTGHWVRQPTPKLSTNH